MIKTAIFHLVAGCLLAAPGSRAAPVVEEPWREVVVSVTDIERSADFFQTIGGYTTLAAGVLSESEIKAWGLPASATANYRLLAPAGAPDGWIRLVTLTMRVSRNPCGRVLEPGTVAVTSA